MKCSFLTIWNTLVCWHPPVIKINAHFIYWPCVQLYEITIKAIERLFIFPPLMWFLLMSVQHFDRAKYGLFLKLRTSSACARNHFYTFHWLCRCLNPLPSWVGGACYVIHAYPVTMWHPFIVLVGVYRY